MGAVVLRLAGRRREPGGRRLRPDGGRRPRSTPARRPGRPWRRTTRFAFHRLFSDADGDGDSDNLDLFQLRTTYLKPSTDPAYKWYFDYDADGVVDNLDVFQVRSRRTIVFQLVGGGVPAGVSTAYEPERYALAGGTDGGRAAAAAAAAAATPASWRCPRSVSTSRLWSTREDSTGTVP